MALTAEQERLLADLEGKAQVPAEVPVTAEQSRSAGALERLAELATEQRRLVGALAELNAEQSRLLAALEREAKP